MPTDGILHKMGWKKSEISEVISVCARVWMCVCKIPTGSTGNCAEFATLLLKLHYVPIVFWHES